MLILTVPSYDESMEKLIIGLVGPIASGKGVVGKYLESAGFTYSSLSDRVREEAVRRGLPLVRKNLQDIGDELRENYGGAVLMELTEKMLTGTDGSWVIDSIKNPHEARYLKEKLGGIIIAINAPAELRMKWFLERSKKRNEDGKTEEDFWKAENRDMGQGEGDMGLQIPECIKLADITIFNDGSEDYLREICDGLLIEIDRIRLEGNSGRIESSTI